jgi:hypothetical protein
MPPFMIGRLRRFRVLAMTTLLLASAGSGVHAAVDVTRADLQAAARALGFLDTLPHDGAIAVGVVYATAAPDGKVQALQAAEHLRGIPGPGTASFQPTLIPIETLSQNADRLDALFLMPDVLGAASTIAETARRRRLVTISDDPSCLEAKCCVLMVRADRRVEIVLDTEFADAVGAHFPSVFLMLVTRR